MLINSKAMFYICRAMFKGNEMNFERQIQKECRVYNKFLVIFIIFISLVLGLFVVWLQTNYDFFSTL